MDQGEKDKEDETDLSLHKLIPELSIGYYLFLSLLTLTLYPFVTWLPSPFSTELVLLSVASRCTFRTRHSCAKEILFEVNRTAPF